MALAFPAEDPDAVATGVIRFRSRTGVLVGERELELPANGNVIAYFSELIPEVLDWPTSPSPSGN
ncbi:MAG TPA: hypothetical protein VMN76_05495, partial [Acidobacteriota bacterium]|nr:hypothetical protein [Acidobacteriota bacterium]